MFARDQYELLDFGRGRKLERFGRYLVDRPCPTAEDETPQLSRDAWAQADARYEREEGRAGRWQQQKALDDDWRVGSDGLLFRLRLTESGQVGIFPEQQENWKWILGQVAAAPKPAKVLNLFAYTGGSTLAAAAAGAEVVHIDASKTAVAWARQNAELSGLSAAPIRWIVEDVCTFVEREIRRGNKYHGVILDPPTYGHGPQGESWQIETHLGALLDCLPALTTGSAFLVITSHWPQLSAPLLRHRLRLILRTDKVVADDMHLRSSASGVLWSGVAARYSPLL